MITENIELTKWQSEIFYLLPHGFNSELVPKVLGISLGTVTNSISSVKKKLMTTSIHHTTSLLIVSDYISVSMLSLNVMSALVDKIIHIKEFDELDFENDDIDFSFIN